MRTPTRKTFALATIAAIAGCSASGTIDDPIAQGRGGTTSGGAQARAGSPSVGGQAPAAGGSPGFAGSYATAGKGSDTTGMGGAPPAIAGSASGGRQNSGGTGAGGRFGSNGGSFAAGGRPSGMGGSSSGGAAAGGRASGGSTAAGGSGAGGPTGTCTDAAKTVTNNGTGKHCGYTYEYWKDSGNGTLILNADGFSVDWSSVNDLLGRKGIRPGSGNLVANYEANYQPNGNSYLCIYGWTRNPLVEYYIVDSWGNWRPPGGQGLVGTVSSDGGTYDIYKIGKTGPSIDGNKAFTQYWSVRTAKKTSGVITIANHIAAWSKAGMPMGSFYEVSMTVEGYQSSGKADVKFSLK